MASRNNQPHNAATMYASTPEKRRTPTAGTAPPVAAFAAPMSITVGGDLDEPLIAATPVVPPVASGARPYLEVVAPATLPEGYTFDAEAGGRTISVQVPPGGVEEGQRFSVPLPVEAADDFMPRPSGRAGRWKDGLCDCFRHGLCHPVVWNACCCPLVLVGQVMNRLKLNWFGKLGNVALLLALTLAYYLLDFSLGIYTPLADIDENGLLMIASLNSHVFYWRAFFGLLFGIVTMVLVCQVRRRVRERHSIPGNACEDCCCAYWCTCCVAAQMARHTADYDTYAGQCCSETGLPSHAPSVV